MNMSGASIREGSLTDALRRVADTIPPVYAGFFGQSPRLWADYSTVAYAGQSIISRKPQPDSPFCLPMKPIWQ